MKRLILSTACLSLCIANLDAQTPITLNLASYTSLFAGTQDTLLNSITSSTYPTLSAATNANWNMTTATTNIPAAISVVPHVQPTTSVFASALFADSSNFTFGPASYIANVQYNIISSGFLELGEHVFRHATHLSSGATDSAIVDAQDITYSKPDTLIKFPATYHSKWSTSYHYDFTFHLDYAGALLSNQLGIVRNYITRTDSVIGWGQMKVLEVNGSSSALTNVLQVQTIISVTDSFFLPGQPAFVLNALLNAFTLTQGQTNVTYMQNYYQANQVSALASVIFTDSSYSTPGSAQTYASSGAIPSSVFNINQADITVSVYPNPVSGNEISIDVPNAQNGKLAYELIDISGRHIASDAFLVTNSQFHTQIQIPSNLATGLYYIRIKNNNQVWVKTIDIIK